VKPKYETGRRHPDMNIPTEKRNYETGSRLVWDSEKWYLVRDEKRERWFSEAVESPKKEPKI
jgi:hypothetical protein